MCAYGTSGIDLGEKNTNHDDRANPHCIDVEYGESLNGVLDNHALGCHDLLYISCAMPGIPICNEKWEMLVTVLENVRSLFSARWNHVYSLYI